MSWDRVERLLGSDNLARLAQKRVGIVGLGSGGGFVALTLAMSGVGRFVLVDDDVLEPTNFVRHVADWRYAGQPKAEAVADLIRQRNPKAEIEVRVGRIEDHGDVLDGLDILLSGVDGEGPKYFLNQACLKRNLTAIYAGVFERGEGGDVVVIRPYDGPCYACWAAEVREGLAVAEGEPGQELDYGMIGPDGTLEAEPGLWLHVTRVAAVQSDLALNELLHGTDLHRVMPGNTVILANREMEIISGQMSLPHTAVWVTVERDPHCLVCGGALQQSAVVDDESKTDAVSLQDLSSATGIVVEENAGDQ